jgi:hypothetical protein
MPALWSVLKIIWSGLKIILIGVLTALPVACATYGHLEFEPKPITGDGYKAFAVEINDYGSYWDADEAEKVLEHVRQESNRTNTVVVLYVHGWHHNASPKDSDFLAFKESLSGLTATLKNNPLFEQARVELTGIPDVSVLGIYVGWRGRSLPWYFDYLTFWGRKAAAERVGAGDFREFILRLQQIYEERNGAKNKEEEAKAKDQNPFMGLVTVGHSFGGQVLFTATSTAIERELIVAGPKNAQQSPSETVAPLNGIGDITLLLNPALEAYQFEKIQRLYSAYTYNCLQTPIFMVVSGEGDWARRIWFPRGRWAGQLFRPSFKSAAEYEMWHQALGEYEPHRTHELEEVKHLPSSLSVKHYETKEIINIDFTAGMVAAEASLMPLKERNRKRFSPVLIAYSSKDLVQGHTGIFTKPFHQFLIEYIAFIEGKRMILRSKKGKGEICQ